jgi:flagellar motor switch protein FliN/FliY
MTEETDDPVDQQAMADEWAAAMEEQAEAEGSTAAADDEIEKVTAAKLNESDNMQNGDVNLEVVLDIPVTIAMEIGRTKISIRNLLQLNQGSVVELDRLAGEPMDVLVNGTLVAHGEVVVVNEKFGIRLTDVISPAERIKNLK